MDTVTFVYGPHSGLAFVSVSTAFVWTIMLEFWCTNGLEWHCIQVMLNLQSEQSIEGLKLLVHPKDFTVLKSTEILANVSWGSPGMSTSAASTSLTFNWTPMRLWSTWILMQKIARCGLSTVAFNLFATVIKRAVNTSPWNENPAYEEQTSIEVRERCGTV